MKLLGKKTTIYYRGCSPCNHFHKIKSKDFFTLTFKNQFLFLFLSIISFFSLRRVVIKS